MKSSSRAALLALCLATAFVPRAVFAEPTAADKATARDLFKEAKALRASGDHKGALAKFETAYTLVPSPITALELARERVAVGQLIEGRELLLEIGRMPPKPNESPEALKAREEATTLADELKPRIPTLTLKLVTRLPSVVVTLDGATIPAATLSTPRRTNPGKHVVVARATGVADRVVDVVLVEKETREVEVHIDAEAPKETPKTVVVPPPPAHTTDTAPTRSYQRFIGIGVGAVGLVVVGVGTVVGLSARSKWNESGDHCPNDLCDPDGARLADDARGLGKTSRIVLGIGAAVVVTGVVLYFTAPSSKSATTVSLSPVGFTLRATF